MQDDDELVYNTPAGRRAALDRMRSLGVEAVRVTMLWRLIAPNTDSRHKPRGFNGAKPGEYPHHAWDTYDELALRGCGARDRGELQPDRPGSRSGAHKRTRIQAGGSGVAAEPEAVREVRARRGAALQRLVPRREPGKEGSPSSTGGACGTSRTSRAGSRRRARRSPAWARSPPRHTSTATCWWPAPGRCSGPATATTSS